jgi:hypothetical protein
MFTALRTSTFTSINHFHVLNIYTVATKIRLIMQQNTNGSYRQAVKCCVIKIHTSVGTDSSKHKALSPVGIVTTSGDTCKYGNMINVHCCTNILTMA